MRNKQKAAEIEAKVNGINLWVLLGAIGLVSWQLAGSMNAAIWGSYEIPLRVLICAGTIYMITVVIGPSVGVRDDLRYSSEQVWEISAHLFFALEGLLIFLPPALFFALIKTSVTAGILATFGFIVFIGSIVEMVSLLITTKAGATVKFPKPRFGDTIRSNSVARLVFIAVLFLVFGDQALALLGQVQGNVNVIQNLGLIAALYLLVLVAIRRTIKSQNLQWTYELETDLLLDSVSVKDALMRIEYRALGPRFQDVMNGFFDNLDRRFVALDASLAECAKLLEEVGDIPAQYASERSARIEHASNAPLSEINALLSDIRECSQHLVKLRDAKLVTKRPGIDFLLQGLVARQKSYEAQAIAAEVRTKELVRNASSQTK